MSAKKPLKILVGCDPECFVTNAVGTPVSAHGMIPGTKATPYPVRSGAVQVDGTALEFNITPAATGDEFVLNVLDVFNQMKAMVPGYTVVIEPSVMFEAGYFATLPPEARELGCTPDYNAYTGQPNPKPDVGDSTLRAAGGHLHIGWIEGPGVDPFDPNHFEDCRDVVKQLDHYLGMYSLTWDKNTARRLLYGKAGAFRPKPYGVEYRTLSNAWLRSPELIRWVYDTAITGVNHLYSKMYIADSQFPGVAQQVIDQNKMDWNRNWGMYLEYCGVTMPPGGSFPLITKKKGLK